MRTGVGVDVGAEVGVLVGDGVRVGVGAGVAVIRGVAVGVAVGTGVGGPTGVGVGVAPGASVTTGVGVAVGTAVGTIVGVGEAVGCPGLALTSGVGVGVAPGASVALGVGVAVGTDEPWPESVEGIDPSEPPPPLHDESTSVMINRAAARIATFASVRIGIIDVCPQPSSVVNRESAKDYKFSERLATSEIFVTLTFVSDDTIGT